MYRLVTCIIVFIVCSEAAKLETRGLCKQCRMHCQYGFKSPCDLCECNAAPTKRDKCSPVMCAMQCDNGFATDPVTRCEVCSCKSEKRTVCSPVVCDMYCNNGFETGDDGCLVCKCKASKKRNQDCPEFICMMHCEKGFKKNEKGCDTCFCNE